MPEQKLPQLRRVVLWELNTASDEWQRVGYVVEYVDKVRIEAYEENLAFVLEEWNESLTMTSKNMSVVKVRPGHPAYFDGVLEYLSRTYAITKE